MSLIEITQNRVATTFSKWNQIYASGVCIVKCATILGKVLRVWESFDTEKVEIEKEDWKCKQVKWEGHVHCRVSV